LVAICRTVAAQTLLFRKLSRPTGRGNAFSCHTLPELSMEEAKPAAAPDITGDSPTAAGLVAPPDDSIIIHPHLYEPQAKPLAPVQLSKQLLKHLGQGDKATAKRYAEGLDGARKALQGALESTTVSEDSVQSALAEYVAALLGLVDAPSKQAASLASSPADTAADAALAVDGSSQQQPSAAAAGQGIKGDSPLRGAVSFTWQDVLVGSAAFTHQDAVFELASVLIAASIWYMRRAASLCRDSASGVASPASMQVVTGRVPRALGWAVTACTHAQHVELVCNSFQPPGPVQHAIARQWVSLDSAGTPVQWGLCTVFASLRCHGPAISR
jgi:hypothetical protein